MTAGALRQQAVQFGGPTLVVVAVGLLGASTSAATQIYFQTALVSVAVVVALYVFVGNSGVISFGQIGFAAVGGYVAGIMTVSIDSKVHTLGDLFPLLRDHTIGNVPSLLLATVVGGVYAALVAVPLMRLSGLAAGIATFAVLEITHNILHEWT